MTTKSRRQGVLTLRHSPDNPEVGCPHPTPQVRELSENSVNRNFRLTATDGKTYDRGQLHPLSIIAVDYIWYGEFPEHPPIRCGKHGCPEIISGTPHGKVNPGGWMRGGMGRPAHAAQLVLKKHRRAVSCGDMDRHGVGVHCGFGSGCTFH